MLPMPMPPITIRLLGAVLPPFPIADAGIKYGSATVAAAAFKNVLRS
ncbi:MAG: hypothetical protein ACYS3N_09015 [Planctomycetota bacterium]